MHRRQRKTYNSIDNLNAKVKISIFHQKQVWEAAQIKILKLILPENYTFMASNTFFIALGTPSSHLKKTARRKLTYPVTLTKHRLVHRLPQNHYHYTVKKPKVLKTRLMGKHQSC